MKWHIAVVVLVGPVLGLLAARFVWRDSRIGLIGNLIAGSLGAGAAGFLVGKKTLLPLGHLPNQLIFGAAGAIFLIALLNFMTPKRRAEEQDISPEGQSVRG